MESPRKKVGSLGIAVGLHPAKSQRTKKLLRAFYARSNFFVCLIYQARVVMA